jgi:hypothetical protein
MSSIVDIIERLEEGQAVFCDDDTPVAARFEYMSIDEMIAMLDRTKTILHAHVLRKPVSAMVRLLELERFPPKTPRNRFLRVWNFRFAGQVWIVLEIPLEDRPYAESHFASGGLSLEGKTPWINVNGKGVAFPIPFGFHLTNTPGRTLYAMKQ